MMPSVARGISFDEPLFWLIAIPIWIAFGLARWMWKSERANLVIERWASDRRFRVVECEQSLNRGPFAWGTGRRKLVYRIAVQTQDGAIFRGWLRCGARWQPVDVRWDSETAVDIDVVTRDERPGFPVILPTVAEAKDESKNPEDSDHAAS
jgi:hypothetical protein